MVHQINNYLGNSDIRYRVAYTFDAGPNACLFLEEKDVPLVLAVAKHCFPASEDQVGNYVRGEDTKPVDVPQVNYFFQLLKEIYTYIKEPHFLT